MTRSFAISMNALALYAIAAILLAAFYFQLALGELPCPLCLLQRVAFAALAFGPILTLRHGPCPRHYGLVIIAALFGATIAARQVFLHILPGDPGYGSSLLGLHYYSWAFLCFAAAILAAAVMLLFDRQFEPAPSAPILRPIEKMAVWLVIGVTLLNCASVLVECGFAACPDNPVAYRLLSEPSEPSWRAVRPQIMIVTRTAVPTWLIGPKTASRSDQEATMKTLFVMVKCDLGAADSVGNIIVDKSPAQAEVYSTTGRYDLLVKASFNDVDEIAAYVQTFIHGIPGVKDTYTFVSFRAYGDFTVF
ncbi:MULTISPECIES: disulfide bond formation protein B [Rhodomicrobium]|uniref:disulfide bond formation protein B n=1 Tax=Rhodomicrobium TaxID=1068 RepID=UPI000B4AF6DB|nr:MULTISPECIES: disulfide bond formation protein B [Rhodomicrobium]